MSLPKTMPVSISLTREDGRVEQIHIGHASQSEDGIVFHLDRLALGALTASVQGRAGERAAIAECGTSSAIDELEFLAERSRRVLADPKKARWHAHERALLNEIVAELRRKQEQRAKAS